jgi:hypothetical protein
LDLPTSGFAQQSFELQRVDFGAPEASGRIGGVQAGFPLWLGQWTIGVIAAAKSDELRAFMLRLRGATRRFLGVDLARPFPLAHITGFAGMTLIDDVTPFTGDCSDWFEVITTDGDSELTLEGVPADLELSIGDYVGFRWTATEDSVAGITWHAPVRVVEAGSADDTGAITVTVEPPVPSCVPDTAVAYLDHPKCVMALVGDQSRVDAINRRLAVQGGSITGIQDLRA